MFFCVFSWCTSCPSLQPSCLSRMQSPCVVSIPASSKGTACSLLLELTGTLGCLIEWQLFHCLGVWQPPADFSCTLPPFRISFAGGATLWTTQMWLSALIKAFNSAENVCCNLLSSLFCDLWNTWHWSHSWLLSPPAQWLSLQHTQTWARLPRIYSARAMVSTDLAQRVNY